jgi:hypothetical protein
LWDEIEVRLVVDDDKLCREYGDLGLRGYGESESEEFGVSVLVVVLGG